MSSCVSACSPFYAIVAWSTKSYRLALTNRLNEFFPHAPHPRSFLKNEITADIHTDRDFERHTQSLDQAEKAGDLLYRAESDATTRRMGISLVKQRESSSGSLVENEIFGPVLPIISVKVGHLHRGPCAARALLIAVCRYCYPLHQ